MIKNNYNFTISTQKKEQLLDNKKFEILLPKNEYVEYLFKYKNTLITIYKSQKCVIQGKESDEVVKLFFDNEITQKYNSINYTSKLVGSDEVGVGDYFGGLVICAAYVDNINIKKILALGVKDSKELTDKKIKDIAQKLIKFVPYQVTEILPNKYNELYKKYLNSHIIKTILHQTTLNTFLNKLNDKNIKVDKIIIDQYVNEQKYNDYLKKCNMQNLTNKHIDFIVHSEQYYLCVACASIIARYYFLIQIEKLSSKYGINLSLGSWNNNIENVSKQIINKYKDTNNLLDVFKQIAKLHFSNTKKLKLE